MIHASVTGQRTTPQSLSRGSSNDGSVNTSEQSRPSNGQGAPTTKLAVIGSPAVEEDESDEEPDDGVSPVTDGMVENVELSPNDTPAEDLFRASSTFNFALKVKASTGGNESNSPLGRREASFPRQKVDAHNTDFHVQYTSMAKCKPSSTKGNQKPRAEQENLHALKSYINQSYLQHLPQRMVATALLDRYFARVHPVWPFLIEDVARRSFDLTWSSLTSLPARRGWRISTSSLL